MQNLKPKKKIVKTTTKKTPKTYQIRVSIIYDRRFIFRFLLRKKKKEDDGMWE